MVLTEDFRPDDAIINLGNGRYTIDAVKYIIGILRDDWNPDYTDGRAPSVDFAEKTKNITFRDQDWIILYSVSEPTEIADINYGFTSTTFTYTLDMFTAQDREHLNKFVEEARRVILNKRRDTFGDPSTTNLTGRFFTEWGIRASPHERTSKGFYRRTLDCRSEWRWRAVETA